jgi:hypothetical protein
MQTLAVPASSLASQLPQGFELSLESLRTLFHYNFVIQLSVCRADRPVA